ncbi:hypothetical protein N9937_00140 [bacterium]|nr:hypothetical protein [bacterium]
MFNINFMVSELIGAGYTDNLTNIPADLNAVRVVNAQTKVKMKDLSKSGRYAKRVLKNLNKSTPLSGISWEIIFDIYLVMYDIETSVVLAGLGGCTPDKDRVKLREILKRV